MLRRLKTKIAVVGGGSSYTPELVEGIILKRDTLPVEELVLIDIEAGQKKVAINCDLVKRMLKKVGMDTKISYTLDRRQGLKNADFVMTQLRVGGLKARSLDESIPLNYSMIGQETTGIGGFFKALRTIPVILDICKDMEDLCPHAWMINFTNPSGIITETILTRTKIKCIGLCNVPINMHYEAAEKLGVAYEDITTNFIGLNHLSFMNHCYLEGKDILEKVLALEKEEGLVKNIRKIDAMDRLAVDLGLMLSPYTQYFFFENHMLDEEKEALKNGSSRALQVMKVEEELFTIYKDKELDKKPKQLEERGGARYSEAAIALVDSIYNNKQDNQVVNVLNNGAIADLPKNCVVEVNAIIGKDGAKPLMNGEMPKTVSALVQSVKAYESYTIEAAITGNRLVAQNALLNNPLVHDIGLAMKAFDDLLVAHRQYLVSDFF